MLGAPSYRHAKAVPPDTTYDIIKQWWRSDDREAAAARQFVETGRGVCFVFERARPSAYVRSRRCGGCSTLHRQRSTGHGLALVLRGVKKNHTKRIINRTLPCF